MEDTDGREREEEGLKKGAGNFPRTVVADRTYRGTGENSSSDWMGNELD